MNPALPVPAGAPLEGGGAFGSGSTMSGGMGSRSPGFPATGFESTGPTVLFGLRGDGAELLHVEPDDRRRQWNEVDVRDPLRLRAARSVVPGADRPLEEGDRGREVARSDHRSSRGRLDQDVLEVRIGVGGGVGRRRVRPAAGPPMIRLVASWYCAKSSFCSPRFASCETFAALGRM